MNSYTLGKDIIFMCESFADKVIDTNLDEYSRRGQFNRQKIWNDIFYGKLAEWGVYFIYLKRNRLSVTTPDMKIYKGSRKSFDADLNWNLYKLHIKSQTSKSEKSYGTSWIFQSSDPLFKKSKEYDIIIGCTVEFFKEDECVVDIKLEKQFSKLIFSEPKLNKFSDNKKALYLKDNNEQ